MTGMHQHAAAFLREVEARPDAPEAGVAHRLTGLTKWAEGDFVGARSHLELALGTFYPDRDRDLAFRFGQDLSVAAMSYLALALWPLGEVDRALDLIERVKSRITEIQHIGTVAYGYVHAIMFEMLRGEFARAAPLAAALAHLAREHDLRFWQAYGEFEEADFDAAMATLDAALATSERTGQRWYDAELYRTRSEILLKRDAAHPAPAAEALLAALGIARAQKARGFGLRAALSLAKLYQSTDRPVEAYDALAPALQGFAPTPEMPEIAEAQALLEALAGVH